MIRELSGYDPDRAEVIAGWPVREGLLCYLNKLRERARENFRTDVMVWAFQSPYCKADPPKLPAVLKED